jgi:hypothetical protein
VNETISPAHALGKLSRSILEVKPPARPRYSARERTISTQPTMAGMGLVMHASMSLEQVYEGALIGVRSYWAIKVLFPHETLGLCPCFNLAASLFRDSTTKTWTSSKTNT